MAQLEPSDSSLADSPWWSLTVRRTVRAEPTDVWSVLSDGSSWIRWYRPLSEFELLDSSVFGLGVTVREKESWWASTATVVEWVEQEAVGMSTRSINAPGLLRRHHRRIALRPAAEGTGTDISITGAFRFGPLGWLLMPYTYPQMMASMYLEYRSALGGLVQHFA